MIVRSGRGYEVPNYDSEEYKEELLSKLKDYKGIIANSLYDYLNSLLGLEISDFSNEISDKQRALLTRVDFELYRYISIYNILCRIQKLFVEDKNKLQIDSDSFSKKLKIFIPGKRINEDNYDEDPNLYLFNFNYKPKQDDLAFKRSPSLSPSTIIGDINLYEYIKREGQNEKNIEAYQRQLEKVEKKRYGIFVGDSVEVTKQGHFGTCNSDLMDFQLHRQEQIEQYLNIIRYYQNKKGLTDEEKFAMEMSQKYHTLLLKELGATSEEFVSGKTYADAKVLKLTRPNYDIKNTIHYVE